MEFVKAENLVEATLSSADVAPAAAKAAVHAGDPSSPACTIAQDNYHRQWRWLGLFDMLWFVLVAGTVILLLVALWLIGSAAFGPGDPLAKATKAAIAIAAAAGTIVTGKAAGFVVAQRKTQADAVKDALDTVGTACGDGKKKEVEVASAKERFKVI